MPGDRPPRHPVAGSRPSALRPPRAGLGVEGCSLYAPDVNWRQFVASMLQTTVWPATALTVVLLFRKKINELLGHRLTRLKAGPVEAEWTETIRETNEAIATERPVEPEPEPAEAGAAVAGPGEAQPELVEPELGEVQREPIERVPGEVPLEAPEPVPGEVPLEAPEPELVPSTRVPRERFRSLLDEVHRLVAIEPNAAVSLGFNIVEQALVDLARSIEGVTISQNIPTYVLIDTLAEQGLISSRVAFAIDNLRHLRNATVHSKQPSVTRQEAAEYVNTLDTVIQTITHPALIYESSVAAAVNRVARAARVQDASESDLIAVTQRGRVAVVVKYLSGRSLGRKDIERGAQAALRAYGGGVLIVTNAPLSQSALDFNNAYSDREHPVEAMTWNSKKDDNLLARAVVRTAR